MSLEGSVEPVRTLIVPVHDAAPFLARTLEQARDWIAARPEAWEVVIVDDASTDASPAVIASFVRDHAGAAVRTLRFRTNRGKGFAVRAGLAAARGEQAVFTDCDLAYPMENVGRIVDALDGGADAAIACRVHARSTYLIPTSFLSYLYTRHVMGRIFNGVCRVLTVPGILDTQAGLKGFRTAAVREILPRLVLDRFSFDVELLRALIDRGARIEQVPVTFRYDSEPTTVEFAADSLRMLRDLLRVRLRSLRGVYAAPVRGAAPPTQVMIHADDFGLSPGINRAIEEGLESGCITSASLFAGAAGSAQAMAWAATHPAFDYGVHLNLTLGRPVLPAGRVPTLVDGTGSFRPLEALVGRWLTGRVRAAEVRDEWRAQIAAVRAAGVVVSHIDSHRHVHLLPGLFRTVAAPMARGEGLHLRAMDGPVYAGLPLAEPKQSLLRAVSRRDFAGVWRPMHVFAGCGTSLMAKPRFEVLERLVSRMRPGGLYELVVHPGYIDETLRAGGDGYVEGREREWRLLGSDEARCVFALSGARLVDHRARV